MSFVYWYTVGLNLVLDYSHNNMYKQLLLSAGMCGKHVCHFCIITVFSTLHVVERLLLNLEIVSSRLSFYGNNDEQL